ncbi:ABC transporter permease [Nonomuraea sp. SYSU D8015]|uniref:ABC transporter permease n=1 Tax=Nonomuraea sp. SYSU D8015 TaxID=2593644 RepID=UPI001CB73568|nr:ABC transporter permease subunit [Nonomuraea sp. SYSU D8015]
MVTALTWRRRALLGAAGLGISGAAAELAHRLGPPEFRVLPSPSSVAVAAVQLAADAEFAMHVSATLAACGLGLHAAMIMAVPAGLLLGALPGTERAVRPVIEFLRAIPSLVLIPLAWALLGDPSAAKTALIAYSCSWPLLITTLYGILETDPLAKDTLRAYGFSPLQVLIRVSLPSTAPHIATGFRLAIAVALIVSISVEVISGSSPGIGTYIVAAHSIGQPERALAATLAAGLLGLAATALCTAAEHRLFAWYRHTAGASR